MLIGKEHHDGSPVLDKDRGLISDGIYESHGDHMLGSYGEHGQEDVMYIRENILSEDMGYNAQATDLECRGPT